jgi:hypothetical protein
MAEHTVISKRHANYNGKLVLMTLLISRYTVSTYALRKDNFPTLCPGDPRTANHQRCVESNHPSGIALKQTGMGDVEFSSLFALTEAHATNGGLGNLVMLLVT